MTLEELRAAFNNEQPLNYKGFKCKVVELQHTLFGDFKVHVRLYIVNQYPLVNIDFLSEKELEVFSLWQEPSVFTLKSLKDACQDQTPVKYKGTKYLITGIQHVTFSEELCFVHLMECGSNRVTWVSMRNEEELKSFTLWQEPTSPFHRECIDLLKDYKLNKEALEVQEALNLIKHSIKAAIKNVGSTEHKFHLDFNPFQVGNDIKLKALQLLAKELPNDYNPSTSTWTFYTSPWVMSDLYST